MLEVGRELGQLGSAEEYRPAQAAAAKGRRDELEFAVDRRLQRTWRDASRGGFLQLQAGELTVRHGRA
jgi:hypothetical protein